jgi:hypothetical protein
LCADPAADATIGAHVLREHLELQEIAHVRRRPAALHSGARAGHHFERCCVSSMRLTTRAFFAAPVKE